MSKKKKKNIGNKRKSVKQKTETVCREDKVRNDLVKETKLADVFAKEEKDNEQIFLQKLNQILNGLIYISETDSEIFSFAGEKLESLNVKSFREQIVVDPDENIEEIEFDGFFENLIVVEDWFEDDEKDSAEKFLKLKNLLEENLKDLRVFKLGEVELEIYIVGRGNKNDLLGIKTRAVET